MNNRVYGLIGIESINSNWNADFDKRPRTDYSGNIIATPAALKYQDRAKMILDNKLVFAFKSEVEVDGVMKARKLDERYEFLFGELKPAKKDKDKKKDKSENKGQTISEIRKNLFKCSDIKNYGAVFASSDKNTSITGAVTIQMGKNIYKDAETMVLQIASPYANSNKDVASTTLGEKIVSDECHYIYPFAINPLVYKEFINNGETDGYTMEDYLYFKENATSAATLNNSEAKSGCKNEFAIFIMLKEGVNRPVYIDSRNVNFTKGELKNTIEITIGEGYLNDLKDQIESVEIYYDPFTTTLSHDIEVVKVFDIKTNKEI